jgi:hypothetical protein
MKVTQYTVLQELLWARQQVVEAASHREKKIQRALDEFRESKAKLHKHRVRLLEIEAKIDALWYSDDPVTPQVVQLVVDDYRSDF